MINHFLVKRFFPGFLFVIFVIGNAGGSYFPLAQEEKLPTPIESPLPEEKQIDQSTAEPFTCSEAQGVSINECETLIALYTATMGDKWTQQNGWLFQKDVCAWIGVSCEEGQITGLNLENNDLKGSIPGEIGNLTGLKALFLGHNQLAGEVPEKFLNLESLAILDLTDNSLTASAAVRDFITTLDPDWEETQRYEDEPTQDTDPTLEIDTPSPEAPTDTPFPTETPGEEGTETPTPEYPNEEFFEETPTEEPTTTAISTQQKTEITIEGSGEEGIHLHLTIPPVQIQEDEQGLNLLTLDGWDQAGLAGNPMLPAKSINLVLPSQAIWDSVRVEVSNPILEELPEGYVVPPVPPFYTWIDGEIIEEWGSNADTIVDAKNLLVYEENAFFPSSLVRVSGFSQMRKWRYVRLMLSPVQYNPVTGKVHQIKELDIYLTYSMQEEQVFAQSFYADTVMNDVAESIFVNYEQAKEEYSLQASSAEAALDSFVIITTENIKNNSTKLMEFAANKAARGFNVEIITEVDYGSLTGQPPNGTAEKIRKWLKDHYLSDQIKYVLLIGNPDPLGDVPMKMCYPRQGESEPEAPTDYFYADLTGNWDLDGDQIYGEYLGDRDPGGVDFAPEVYVGRIPVYSGVAELDSILQKTVNYQNANLISWRESGLIPMSFLGTNQDFAYLGDQIRKYLKNKGFVTFTMYQHKEFPYCTSPFSSNADLVGDAVKAQWSANPYGVVTWIGHGDETSTIVGYDKYNCYDGTLFSSADAPALDNDHPAYVFQGSCSNGYPENSGNLGYALLKNGAIATISSSRNAYYSFNAIYPDTERTYADMGNLEYYTTTQFVRGNPVGEGFYNEKALMEFGWEGSSWANLMGFNIYGDPSVSINDTGLPFSDCSTAIGTPQAECQALVDLYNATKGESWIQKENWLASNSICEWVGVTCESGHISEIDLNENGLKGNLPASLGDLNNLEKLDLEKNTLSGSIPVSLGTLSDLEYLRFGENGLTGSIPEGLGTLSSLKELLLNNNQLSGDFPPSLANLLQLVRLNLSENQIGGSIPAGIGDLTDLEILNLGSNNLTGEIPSGIGALADLTTLNLQSNQLTGAIPISIGNLSHLELLRLEENQLDGQVPNGIWGLNQMQELSLGMNRLEGVLPSGVGSLTQLRLLDLQENRLDSTIPTELGSLVQMQYLFLNNNSFYGEIPTSIVNLVNLDDLDIGHNRLTASDPAVITFLNAHDPDWAATQDAIPPVISKVDSSASTADHQLTPDETVSVNIKRLLVTFSEPVQNPDGNSDPYDVTNPANYGLTNLGADIQVGGGDDTSIIVDNVMYSNSSRIATIYLNGDQALPVGRYQFTVSGSTSIKDFSGNKLDGNGDGIGGDDFELIFSVSKAPGKPVLVSPAYRSHTNDTTPELTWEAPVNAATYEIQIDNSSGFNSPDVTASGLGTTSFVVPDGEDLSNGKMYWRVRAVDMFGMVGGWSHVWYFTIDTVVPSAPLLSSPSDNATSRGTPTYKWKSVTGAKYYQFQYTQAADLGFASPVYTSAELTAQRHKPPLQPLGVYLWRVRAKDLAGNWGNWSNPRMISIEPTIPTRPELVSPNKKMYLNDNTPSLDWVSVDYAETYQLQISKNSRFSEIIMDVSGLVNTEFTTLEMDDGRYYWRVRGVNDKLEMGSWSAVWYFNVDTTRPDAPQLKSPSDQGRKMDMTPGFSWRRATSAKWYQVEILDEELTPVLSTDFRTSTRYTVLESEALEFGRYHWHVRAQDLAGNISEWSETWQLDITPLRQPSEGAFLTDTTPRMTWYKVPNALAYRMQISNVPNFEEPIVLDTGVLPKKIVRFTVPHLGSIDPHNLLLAAVGGDPN